MATTSTAPRKLRPPLKWHGGKAYLARRIVALFPPHRTYVEPFLGGGSVLLNKPRSPLEVAGDVNPGLVEFWATLRADGPALSAKLRGMSYSRAEFERRRASGAPHDRLSRAVAFLVRNRFSRGGLGRDFAWSERLRGGRPGDVNAWDTIRAELPRIAGRVRRVEFYCLDALQLVQAHDGPGVLFYCDPPYLPETRTHRTAYDHEMGRGRHEELLDVLCSCRGAVCLSGYPSRPYDEKLTGWDRHTFDMPNHSGQGKRKQRRTEVLWVKPAAK